MQVYYRNYSDAEITPDYYTLTGKLLLVDTAMLEVKFGFQSLAVPRGQELKFHHSSKEPHNGNEVMTDVIYLIQLLLALNRRVIPSTASKWRIYLKSFKPCFSPPDAVYIRPSTRSAQDPKEDSVEVFFKPIHHSASLPEVSL